ncbi:hypothetical protein SHIRM173S_04518 [Streptomyces hirsutus]
MAALSLRHQIAAAVALGIVAVVVCAHIGMTFLHVAPANTVSKEHAETIEDWIYPEFEQNWKLFAPNPLQQDISVQVRAEVLTPDGGVRTTGWYDLSAEDGRAIDGNLLPSHTQQNDCAAPGTSSSPRTTARTGRRGCAARWPSRICAGSW